MWTKTSFSYTVVYFLVTKKENYHLMHKQLLHTVNINFFQGIVGFKYSPGSKGNLLAMSVTRCFFDIIVKNEDIFDFSWCRHFLDHMITPKIGNSPIALNQAFLAQFWALFAPLYVFDLFDNEK